MQDAVWLCVEPPPCTTDCVYGWVQCIAPSQDALYRLCFLLSWIALGCLHAYRSLVACLILSGIELHCGSSGFCRSVLLRFLLCCVMLPCILLHLSACVIQVRLCEAARTTA